MRHYRDRFEMMRDDEMVWEPYALLLEAMPGFRVWERPIWRVRVPLICYATVEHHYPDHVLRQFGIIQPIPQPISFSRDELRALHNTYMRSANWPQILRIARGT